MENEGKVLGNVGDTVLNLFRLSVADETPMEVSVALLRQLNKIHGWVRDRSTCNDYTIS